ncbi:MAG: FecR domain-containing protein [Opitutaceae bacterium]|nr:FecR domain-containing protein [Opitutaceae bacterium]
MNKKYLTWLWLLGVAAFLCLDASAQTAQAPGQIKVAKVTGTATAIKDGNTITLQNGTELSQGYVVNTGKNSSVVLVFSNGATLNLAQDTSLSIDEYTQDPFAEEQSVSKLTAEPSTSKTKLNLSRGELVGNVKKLNYDAGSSFSIQTPVGAAGIRGTTFRIIFRPDGTGKAFFSLTTVEGNVVLAAGTVNLPTETSVPDNKEVEVMIDVNVDAETGVVTVAVGSGPPVVVADATPTSVAAVAAVAQQIATAVAAVTFTAPTPTPPPTTPPAETPPAETPPPPVTPPTPRVTTGDGG